MILALARLSWLRGMEVSLDAFPEAAFTRKALAVGRAFTCCMMIDGLGLRKHVLVAWVEGPFSVEILQVREHGTKY